MQVIRSRKPYYWYQWRWHPHIYHCQWQISNTRQFLFTTKCFRIGRKIFWETWVHLSCKLLTQQLLQIFFNSIWNSMDRNLAHQNSCDLHSSCHEMVLTACFYRDSRAHNVRKVRVVKYCFLWWSKSRLIKNIAKTKNGGEKPKKQAFQREILKTI